MTEQQRKAPGRPAAERYYAEYISLSTAEASVEAALQAAINERAKLGWKLVSMTKDPSGVGLFLVWDTSGLFSG
ncbi:MAG TPA: hypothetical protein VK357_12510 [Rubrobacteraceae bacterium]|nr:hypothetical protein [Rubrobacteraceae bacterium]